MAHQKLTTEVETKGAQQSAQELGKVESAQKGVVNVSEQAVPVTNELADATGDLAANTGNYAGVAGQLSPSLGLLISTMEHAAKIANDLGNKQFKLKEIFKATTGGVAKYAGALKLIGAGSAVFLGVKALTFALEEQKRVTKELQEIEERRAQQFIDDEKKVQEATARGIALARKRFEGGLTGEEVTALEQAIRVNIDRVAPDLAELLVSNLVSAIGTEIANVNILELTRIGGQVDPAAPPSVRGREFERALNRARDRGEIQREEQQRRDTEARRRAQETASLRGDPMAVSADLEARVRAQKGGLNDEELAEVVALAERFVAGRGRIGLPPSQRPGAGRIPMSGALPGGEVGSGEELLDRLRIEMRTELHNVFANIFVDLFGSRQGFMTDIQLEAAKTLLEGLGQFQSGPTVHIGQQINNNTRAPSMNGSSSTSRGGRN